MTLKTQASQTWDLFCKVVDNFGDIGVCWRLAHQLADEYGIHVRLWVDDLALAQTFAGAGHAHIQLQHWTNDADFSRVANVVIETFGCGLPEAYQQQMLSQHSIWVNIDYLSAEPWVEGFHAQHSPQTNGLVRHFFYPGFTARTGGLLREAGLATLQAQASWPDIGLLPAPDKLTVSLFCYAHAPLAALVDSLQTSSVPVRVLVPQTVAPLLAKVLKLTELHLGARIQRQQCEFLVIPFLSQTDYDRLLYLCDFNFVRGEDSWIRALWAGKPMIWLPYQQSEDTHLLKLNAFMHHYLAQADGALHMVTSNAMLAWAQGTWQVAHWQSLLGSLPQLTSHASAFKVSQSQQLDLATNLVIFIEKYHTHRV
ncbi:elongation factor P maturation arginine rhamnosyltransferase EarP [Methylophilus sp. 5]|uniref:elongation factor P maturation arginine rhamnosyltransferase EarP n=1 Tax=Methylophilus sp. 5 TaxID=1112274 RepID=UPI00048F9AB8|nr:elongation factor P maturation arginine rhamnosyltransferase EarP [Methylophilus sp. 5]